MSVQQLKKYGVDRKRIRDWMGLESAMRRSVDNKDMVFGKFLFLERSVNYVSSAELRDCNEDDSESESD